MADNLGCTAADLTELVEYLRRSDFRVDTRQYLLAHELLLGLAARGHHTFDADVAKLAAYLGPIFCTSPDEQERFPRIVSEWRNLPRPEPPRPPAPPRPPVPYWRRWRWALATAAAGLPLAIVGAGYGYYYYAPLTVRAELVRRLPSGEFEAAAGAQVQIDGVGQPVDESGAFVIRVARARTVRVVGELEGYQAVTTVVSGLSASPVSLRFEPASDPVDVQLPAETGAPARIFGVSLPVASTTSETDWLAALIGATAVGTVVWTILWLLNRLRRRLALKRLPRADDPELITLRPQAPPTPIANPREAKRAALWLRRARDEADQVMQLTATIEASARNGGFFTPQFVPRRSVPEYLVLIDRRSREDHHARIISAMLEVLRSHAVALDVYWFREDPRICTDDSGGHHRLAEIVNRHHRATLVLCAETTIAFSASSNRVLPWVQICGVLPSRVFLTPEPPYRWAHRERALVDVGFLVLPASETGWQQLGELQGAQPGRDVAPAYARALPSLLAGSDRRWLDRNEPPPDIVDRLLRQLEAYLGTEGFRWLCACAVYPEISWPLTLRLGPATPSADVLRGLARLPWLRRGYMPDWLRSRLLERTTTAEDKRIRDILEQLIAELGTPSNEHGESTFTIGRLVSPIDVLHAAPSESPLSDRILLGFVAGVRQDRLSVSAPRELLRFFRRRPGEFRSLDSGPPLPLSARLLSPFRSWTAYRPSRARWAIAFGVSIIAASSLAGMLTVAKVNDYRAPIWFIEVPRQELTLGAVPETIGNALDVRTFFISRTEVTVGQYRACVEEDACSPADASGLDDPDDWPMRRVSWPEAMEYCAWLENRLRSWPDTPADISDALLGRYGRLSSRVTLPSEPEWELAARGTDGRRFPWGDTIAPYVANYAETRRGGPTAVGTFPIGESTVGALDFAGNVSEWTRSVWLPYPYRPGSNQERESAGAADTFTIRGGSFADDADNVSATSRAGSAAGEQTSQLGFRVAISSLALTERIPGSRTMIPADLSREVNSPIDWLTRAPESHLTLGPVRLELVDGRNRAITMGATFRDDLPNQVAIDVQVRQPTAVHVLVSGSWVVDLARGTPIGRITLRFATGSASYDLIAGVNIREGWEFRNAVTRLSPEAVAGTRWRNVLTEDQLRQAPASGGRPAVAYLDLLTLDVPANHLNDVLTGIVLEDLVTAAERTTDRVSVNPSFSVSAITMESIGELSAAR